MGADGVQGRGDDRGPRQRVQGYPDGGSGCHGERPPRDLLLPAREDLLRIRAVGPGAGRQVPDGGGGGRFQWREVQEQVGLPP